MRSPQELSPSARVALRFGDEDFGFPWPFSYLPPVYGRLILIYDTLLHRDSTGKLIPWLAAGHRVSPDRLVHTFDLRDNVRWHDGRPFTADDVVFSFEFFQAGITSVPPKIPPFVLFKPDHVAEVRRSGSNSVEFRLDKPAVTFDSNVAGRFLIVPAHVWAGVNPPGAVRAETKFLIGTGPYRLESYSTSASRYVANDDFFLGRPFVKRIDFKGVGDQLAALRADEIDGAGFSIGPTNVRSLQPFLKDSQFGYTTGSPEFTVGLYWNLEKKGALSDVRFRRACAMAIDRRGIVRRLLGGNGAPGNPGFLPPDHPFRADVQQYRYGRAAADRLLDEAGYERASSGMRRGPRGERLKFRLSVDPALGPPAELVQQALKRLGIDIELDPVQQFTVGSGFDMALFFHGGLQEDPDLMRTVYSSRVADRLFFSARGYRNEEFDDLADRQLITADEAERRQMVARMQQIVAADLPLLHLYYPTPFFIFRKSVLDQWPSGRTPDSKLVFITGVGTEGTTIRPIKE